MDDLAGDQELEETNDLKDSNDDELDTFNLADPPVINLPGAKAFKRNDLFSQLIGTIIRHPRDYMVTLVRLGFEPLPGSSTTSLISRQPQLRLPGFFSYMGYIVKNDGFFGIYRGLHYNLAYSISYDFTYKNVNSLLMKIPLFAAAEDNSEEAFDSVGLLMSNLTREVVARVFAHAVTYPLKVIAIRSMAQFVGGETFYDSWLGAITNVYETGGFGGFYPGIVAICLADAFYVAARWTMYYFLRDKLDRNKRTTIFLATNLLADSATNPFRTVATVMACNGPTCSLAAATHTGPSYDSWLRCLCTLWTKGEVLRGGSLFWRTRPLPKSLVGPHDVYIVQHD